MSPLNLQDRRRLVLLVVTMILLAVGLRAEAAYRITSPINASYGHISQDYLYGIGTAVHKGVDYSVPTDTYFYAVTDGVIVEINEDIANGCRLQNNCTNEPFGNFVLIRHSQRHYNRATGNMDYVYSLYAHLSFDSIPFNVGTPVAAGQIVGRTDNTGNSTGPHFHLQIMIDPDPNRIMDLTWTEVESRNPELWLNPYNGNTGTVVGKVTNTNGDALGGVTIYGALSGSNSDGLAKNPAWVYTRSLTYNSTALKADDIFVENWGTTDVTPGYYDITTSVGGNLGRHEVRAGRITYVGLYPVWVPYVISLSTWNSSIIVRNNSDTYRAQVVTTFFNPSGWVSQG